MNVRILPGGIEGVRGIRARAGHAGIKKKRPDVAILYSERPQTTAAALFTRNRAPAAPVLVSRSHISRGTARAIVVNSGCANACTGETGLRDARSEAAVVAAELGIEPEEVLVASTGVIGRYLPMDLLLPALRKLASEIQEPSEVRVSEAILTTDTVPKEVLLEATLPEGTFRIGGVAKGSGMIHPDLATLLVFLATDAEVPPALLDLALREAVSSTLGQVSIDGDTSTNDMIAILATGASGTRIGPENHPLFTRALEEACRSLALQIARDGEGATTLIEAKVEGARTLYDARIASRSIVRSNLVKSAIHGRDPNWGRVVAALGSSGAAFDPSKVEIWIGNPEGRVRVVEGGTAVESLDVDLLRTLLSPPHVQIVVHLHLGEYSATAWGCDLSEEYVKINASYTT